MCLPFREDDPAILHGALPTLLHAIALFALIFAAALGKDLRPHTPMYAGRAGRGGPRPPSGSASAPLFKFPVWRPQ
ncbi:hypothetical protein GCM10011609_77170 [Lentzea pudingi]|uniref:Uncharacterized protein n=1 Tax=Lentzea pudingi TaxID=1789439 RepID=A0ABQ2INW8_9PSEU|nr:hypothetical protein GCM10011609_77170 [Lentzea pudingi]